MAEKRESILMTLGSMIDQAFGTLETNTVDFKMIHTILLILARALRILERRVQIKVGSQQVTDLATSYTSMSITELKLLASAARKRRQSENIDALFSKSKTTSRKSKVLPEGKQLYSVKSDEFDQKSQRFRFEGDDKESPTTSVHIVTPTATDDTSKSHKDLEEKHAKAPSAHVKKSKLFKLEPESSEVFDEGDDADLASKSKTKKKGRVASDKKEIQSEGEKSKTIKDRKPEKPEKSVKPEKRTRKDFYQILSKLEIEQERELRIIHQRADSQEEPDGEPPTMTSGASIAGLGKRVQEESIIIVERGSSGQSRTSKSEPQFSRKSHVGRLSIVTLEEFEDLQSEVRELAMRLRGIGSADFPDNEQLMLELRKGASLTDAMAALQLAARLEAAEKALQRLTELLAEVAKAVPGGVGGMKAGAASGGQMVAGLGGQGGPGMGKGVAGGFGAASAGAGFSPGGIGGISGGGVGPAGAGSSPGGIGALGGPGRLEGTGGIGGTGGLGGKGGFGGLGGAGVGGAEGTDVGGAGVTGAGFGPGGAGGAVSGGGLGIGGTTGAGASQRFGLGTAGGAHPSGIDADDFEDFKLDRLGEKVTSKELMDLINGIQDEFTKKFTSLSKKVNDVANNALISTHALEEKMEALQANNQLEEIEVLISKYTERINKLDTEYTGQLGDFQEKLTQMQFDLEVGLDGMMEALANTTGDPAAVAELNNKFTALQNDFDTIILAQKDLHHFENRLGLDLQSLYTQVEILKDVKCDREEVEDALKDKAGIGALNGLVTLRQFDSVRGDLEKKIGVSYDKFNSQEIIWQKAIDDLSRDLSDKADIVQVEALRDDVNNNIVKLHKKTQILADIVGEPRAAAVTKMLFRDTACISCSTPARMDINRENLPELPAMRGKRPPVPGAEEESQPKEDGDHGVCYPGWPVQHELDPRVHICRRYCGGSHTLVPQVAKTSSLIGVKGLNTSKLPDEKALPLKPCVPCNLPKWYLVEDEPKENIVSEVLKEFTDMTPTSVVQIIDFAGPVDKSISEMPPQVSEYE